MQNAQRPGALTQAMEDIAGHWRAAPFEEPVLAVAKTCITDWLAVTLAALETPLARSLLQDLCSERSAGRCTAFGASGFVGPRQAAEVNGTLGHALDYDDVNLGATAHVTAAVLPAALAWVQQGGGSGEQLLRAFVAGTEAMVALGVALGPSHYARGFHATGTLGAIGGTVAAAVAADLSAESFRSALGLAATRAAGLKASFGTMAKPLHAGHAAALGVSSVRLAGAGFTGNPAGLDAAQGFADTHSDGGVAPLLVPPPRPHILDTLFKYNAACFGTHATIEAVRKIVLQHAFDAQQVVRVVLVVDPTMEAMCNQTSPRTGLQSKFSMTFNAALALSRIDTAAIATYGEQHVSRPELQQLSEKVQVRFRSGGPQMACEAEVVLDDGRCLRASHDAGVPERDVALQRARVAAKFSSLASPAIGERRAQALLQMLGSLETLPSIEPLMAAASGTGCGSPMHH